MAVNAWTKASSFKEKNMANGKGKFWKKRGGSSRMSMLSNQSQESKTETGPIADAEEEFLHAAEFGDIPTVKRLLAENPDLNVDCIDALGRTALRLAVKNEHLEVVEVLLEKSSSRHVYEAVLQAISAGHVQIAESILKHKRYLELWKERKKLGDDDHFFKTQFEESQFSPDITPLILASEKNQYEIVQLLLLRGEKIHKPHKFGCLCRECVNKMKFDQLRSAKYRLNAYRGLSSEAYISLSSKDPILTAFQLSKELKSLSGSEKYFKVEYNELSNQLSEYVVKLLDRVRTQRELELVLNKTGKANEERYSDLARLKLALQYKEKKFVAHPSCQQRLDKSWYQGIDPFMKAGIIKRMGMIFFFVLAYPFLTLVYIIVPKANFRWLKILRFPWVKFSAHTTSFITFLLMIIVTTMEATYVFRRNSTLASDYPNEFRKYEQLRNVSGAYHFGNDLPIRQKLPTNTQVLITLWIFGFLYHECVQIYSEGVASYTSSLYNLMDFALLMLYSCSFTLKYLVMVKYSRQTVAYMRLKVKQNVYLGAAFCCTVSLLYATVFQDKEIFLMVFLSIQYFKLNNIAELIRNADMTQYSLYWLMADRYYWPEYDPINISEGLFAIANILSFSRISYLLPALEALGPLQISFGRMMKDVMKCLCLLCLVLVAFVVGLQNLYWYYNMRGAIEIVEHTFVVPAQAAFGDAVKTFRTVFWSVFGRGESSVVRLGEYDNELTEHLGYVIYGLYNVIMVTVLVNMLIAMMARSFQAIAESSDVEWKFSRSLLYMEYISEDEVLPVPFNIARVPRSIFEWIFDCCDTKDGEEELDMNNGFAQLENGFITHDDRPPPVRKVGEPILNIAQVSSELKKRRTDSQTTTSDISAVDMYEGNMTSGDEATKWSRARPKHMHRPSLPGLLDNGNSYQTVMQRIIQRYIFDIQREAEVTEDDFEEIKQDLSSFRYEMLNMLQRKEQQFTDFQVKLGKLYTAVTGQPPSQPGTQPSTPTMSRHSRVIPPKLKDRMSSRECIDSIISSSSIDEDGVITEEGTQGTDSDRQYTEEKQQDAEARKQTTEDSQLGTEDYRQESEEVGQAEPVEIENIEPAKTDDDEECYVYDNPQKVTD